MFNPKFYDDVMYPSTKEDRAILLACIKVHILSISIGHGHLSRQVENEKSIHKEYLESFKKEHYGSIYIQGIDERMKPPVKEYLEAELGFLLDAEMILFFYILDYLDSQYQIGYYAEEELNSLRILDTTHRIWFNCYYVFKNEFQIVLQPEMISRMFTARWKQDLKARQIIFYMNLYQRLQIFQVSSLDNSPIYDVREESGAPPRYRSSHRVHRPYSPLALPSPALPIHPAATTEASPPQPIEAPNSDTANGFSLESLDNIISEDILNRMSEDYLSISRQVDEMIFQANQNTSQIVSPHPPAVASVPVAPAAPTESSQEPADTFLFETLLNQMSEAPPPRTHRIEETAAPGFPKIHSIAPVPVPVPAPAPPATTVTDGPNEFTLTLDDDFLFHEQLDQLAEATLTLSHQIPYKNERKFF